jgi:ribonuclease G
MPKELVISATPYETRVAIVEEGQLCEIYIEREKEFALVGSIYKGRVTRVLPGMQSAFVDIGLDGDAFLYVSDFLEHLEEYDHIVTTVEGKLQKMEQQGGQMFAPAGGQTSAVQPPEVMPASPTESEKSAPHDRNAPAPASPGHFSAPPAPGAPPHERRDFSSDRGRGRRGRWGRRGRGHRGRDRGRELPPSKFASPRPYEPRPYEPPAYEPPASEAEPILLPGESLAKYKDRIPAVPLAPPAHEGPAPGPSEVTSPPAESPRNLSSPALPESVYAPAPELAPESHPHTAEAAPPSETDAAMPVEPEEAPAEQARERLSFEAPPAAAGAAAARQEPELSEDEMTALAEQLAEAKHEEAQAQAQEAEESELGESEQEEGAPLEALAETDEPHELDGEAETIEAPAEAASGLAPVEAAGLEVVEPPEPVEPEQVTARVEERPRAHFQRPMRRGERHRGGRFARHHNRFQARRPQLISEMLRPNQEIIVQIAKEPLGKKGARITSHVALPGRYLVYMPTVDHIGVSRKIASAEERARLRRLVAESKGTFPGGFIVRTAAEGATDDEIRSDVEFLGRTWDEIRARAEQRKAPALLHRDLNLVERILRDYLSHDYASIWVDSEEEFSKVVDFVSRFQPKLVSRIKLYTKETPIFEEFGIQQELDKALRPKVWLKSGGYIVINHTEALVAIDVNTGKYVGRGSTRLEDTIVKTNLEAVKEIVRQIRLRDLGGIIVVDFIDMEERRNREKVMAALESALQSDRAPSKVLSFNEFGLVAITRKRTKQALERVLCQPCPYCTGSGMVKSIPTICYEIQAEARKMSAELDAQSLTLRVHPEIAKALKTRESALVEELEQATRKSVIIQSDPTLHWEQYDIY